jgi:N-acetylmuramoyl-L-alanine amidase
VIKETGTGWLRVRDEAAGTGEEVARVDVGQHYKYLSNMEGWLEIEYSPGKTGWISGQFADIVR